jgi:hypothetical protein
MLDTELADAGLVSAKQILIIKEKSHQDTEIKSYNHNPRPPCHNNFRDLYTLKHTLANYQNVLLAKTRKQ